MSITLYIHVYIASVLPTKSVFKH